MLAAAADASERGVRGAMATVIERHGSAPGTPGQKLLVTAEGVRIGSVGGGAVEKTILDALVAMLGVPDPAHSIREVKLGPELGMCCGGRQSMLLEPLTALLPCLIFGAGHVARAAAPLLAKVGFAVTVVDARDGWAERIAADSPTVRGVTGELDEMGRETDPSGACLVMTHDHALDQVGIEWALKRGFAFVGGVGSRSKAERTRQRLEAKGFPEADRARLRMPIGLAIEARLPDEIAVAIAGELIAWSRARRTKTGAG